MRKSLIVGVSCLALGLAGEAFAAGQGTNAGQGTGATGLSSSPGVAGGNTSGDLGSNKGGGASGTSNSTTSQREACPPGTARTGDGPCIKKGQ